RGEVLGPAGVAAVRSAFAFQLPPSAPEAERRIALARWLTDPANPLFARVIVNRLWHYHFGTGLVDTPNDFGFNGGRPTHPELLDWLASEFSGAGSPPDRRGVQGGAIQDTRESSAWSIKRIHRLIALSATYRQGTAFNAAAN